MTVVISDPYVLVDIDKMGLIPRLLELDISLHTVYEVLLFCPPALRRQFQPLADAGKFVAHVAPSLDMNHFPFNFDIGFSDADKAALQLGITMETTIVTRDNLIFKWCKRNNLQIEKVDWLSRLK